MTTTLAALLELKMVHDGGARMHMMWMQVRIEYTEAPVSKQMISSGGMEVPLLQKGV